MEEISIELKIIGYTLFDVFPGLIKCGKKKKYYAKNDDFIYIY